MAALEELQEQLTFLHSLWRRPGPNPSPLLQRAAAKAPSAGLQTYLAGKAARRRRPELGETIDDNVKLLEVLASQMQEQVAGMEELQIGMHERMQQVLASAASGEQEDRDAPGPDTSAAVDASLLAAALVDVLLQDVGMVVSLRQQRKIVATGLGCSSQRFCCAAGQGGCIGVADVRARPALQLLHPAAASTALARGSAGAGVGLGTSAIGWVSPGWLASLVPRHEQLLFQMCLILLVGRWMRHTHRASNRTPPLWRSPWVGLNARPVPMNRRLGWASARLVQPCAERHA